MKHAIKRGGLMKHAIRRGEGRAIRLAFTFAIKGHQLCIPISARGSIGGH